MTLKEMRTQPLVNILDKMDMVDLKVHTDDRGNIAPSKLSMSLPPKMRGARRKEGDFNGKDVDRNGQGPPGPP